MDDNRSDDREAVAVSTNAMPSAEAVAVITTLTRNTPAWLVPEKMAPNVKRITLHAIGHASGFMASFGVRTTGSGRPSGVGDVSDWSAGTAERRSRCGPFSGPESASWRPRRDQRLCWVDVGCVDCSGGVRDGIARPCGPGAIDSNAGHSSPWACPV